MLFIVLSLCFWLSFLLCCLSPIPSLSPPFFLLFSSIIFLSSPPSSPPPLVALSPVLLFERCFALSLPLPYLSLCAQIWEPIGPEKDDCEDEAIRRVVRRNTGGEVDRSVCLDGMMKRTRDESCISLSLSGSSSYFLPDFLPLLSPSLSFLGSDLALVSLFISDWRSYDGIKHQRS